MLFTLFHKTCLNCFISVRFKHLLNGLIIVSVFWPAENAVNMFLPLWNTNWIRKLELEIGALCEALYNLNKNKNYISFEFKKVFNI